MTAELVASEGLCATLQPAAKEQGRVHSEGGGITLTLTISRRPPWEVFNAWPDCACAVDEQLYKEVEGALEFCLDGLTAAAAAVKSSGSSSGNGAALTDPTLLQVSCA